MGRSSRHSSLELVQAAGQILGPPPQNIIPMVIESGSRGERSFDIYSLLLRERIILFLTAEVAQYTQVS